MRQSVVSNQPEDTVLQSEKEEEEEEDIDEKDKFHNFEWLWGRSRKHYKTFQEKINVQKDLLFQMLSLKERAIDSLSSWLESKSRGQRRYTILEQSSRYIVLEVGNIQLKVAHVPTQKITINEVNKIFYNEQAIKNIKRYFKVYQNLFKLISKQLKTQNNLKLRLPLSVYIEYKGVCCIATKLNQG